MNIMKSRRYDMINKYLGGGGGGGEKKVDGDVSGGGGARTGMARAKSRQDETRPDEKVTVCGWDTKA